MRVCIVGGGGGASNAANVVRRLDSDAQIDIFTDRSDIGHQPCEIPFVLSGYLDSWDDTFVFRHKFYEQRSISVHFDTRVTKIVPEEKRLLCGAESHSYDKLILDLGAVPVTPPIPGTDGRNEYTLATKLSVAKAFEQALCGSRTAAIVGTGQIALEVASILVKRAYDRVHLIGRSGSLLRSYLDEEMAATVADRVKSNGIELMLDTRVNAVCSENGGKRLSLPDTELSVDFVFFAVGSRPNIALAEEAGIRVGDAGAIAVDEYLQTSEPHIYAIGDCSESWDAITGSRRLYQTATNAARGGRIAATNAVLGNVLPYAGTTMPFVMDTFGLQVGTVGFTEREARERGIDVSSVVTRTATRRRSFGGKPITLKLIADRQARTLIGAQVISEELVAGKIDRLALAIAREVPIDQLAVIDTCYHPTVGTAYEPVVMAVDDLRLALDGRPANQR
jgi:NADPH-dependent 2,4-dienoyl-CoA reductase/sulfur reductase-like enzyme